MRRVVVTGMAGVTALGTSWADIRTAFAEGRTGVRFMPEWDRYTDLNTRIGFTPDEVKKLVDLDYDYMNANDVAFKEWWDKELKS